VAALAADSYAVVAMVPDIPATVRHFFNVCNNVFKDTLATLHRDV
jgi:hypothetical protein